MRSVPDDFAMCFREHVVLRIKMIFRGIDCFEATRSGMIMCRRSRWEMVDQRRTLVVVYTRECDRTDICYHGRIGIPEAISRAKLFARGFSIAAFFRILAAAPPPLLFLPLILLVLWLSCNCY